MKKTISFDGQERTLECNALLPRLYRHEFGRDLIVDMRNMVDASKDNPEVINTECLENIAWLMMKIAGEDVGSDVESWLTSLDDSFAIYNIIGDVVDLWLKTQKTTSKPKKK